MGWLPKHDGMQIFNLSICLILLLLQETKNKRVLCHVKQSLARFKIDFFNGLNSFMFQIRRNTQKDRARDKQEKQRQREREREKTDQRGREKRDQRGREKRDQRDRGK